MSTFLQQLINGITLGAIYALIALGYTMVYGVLKLINFAHGDVFMVGAFMGFYLANGIGVRAAQSFMGNPEASGFGRLLSHGLVGGGGEPSLVTALIVMLLAMVICALLGMLIERLAYRPVRKYSRLTALITAIGVSLLLENGGQFLFGADPKPFPQLVTSRYIQLPGGAIITNQDLIVLVIAIILMIALQLIVYRTKTGKAMRAVSVDPEAASMMGIDVDRVISITFLLGSALAGAAGVMTGIVYQNLNPYMGFGAGLKAFTAAVVGGIGNIGGAMLGGLLIGIAETLTSGYLSSQFQDLIVFSLLVVFMLFRPTGIRGTPLLQKV